MKVVWVETCWWWEALFQTCLYLLVRYVLWAGEIRCIFSQRSRILEALPPIMNWSAILQLNVICSYFSQSVYIIARLVSLNQLRPDDGCSWVCVNCCEGARQDMNWSKIKAFIASLGPGQCANLDGSEIWKKLRPTKARRAKYRKMPIIQYNES